jgi:thiamine-phosphate pyrophosphorylase
MMALPRPALCLVTDRRALAPDARTDAAQVALLEGLLDEAIDAGIDLIQIREGDLPACDVRGLAERVASRARQSSISVLVNDRADVAFSLPDVGLHLKSDGPPAPVVRAWAGPDRLIGRSIHEPIDSRLAEGADFLVFGTVFPSLSKSPDATPAGAEALRRACAHASVPVLAIGGLTPERVAECRRAGAAGMAAIGIFLPPGRAKGALGPRDAAVALRRAWAAVK